MELKEKVVLTNPEEYVEIFRKDKYGYEYMGFIYGSEGIETKVKIETLGTNYIIISLVINGNLICSYHNVDSYKINLKNKINLKKVGK